MLVGQGGMRHEGGRASRWLKAAMVPVTVALVVSAVGCSGGGTSAQESGRAGQRSSSSGTLSAHLAAATGAVQIVAGRSPGEVSIGVSRAVFAGAPVAVVAGARDQSGIRDGAGIATRLGVPMLLIDDDGQPVSTPDTRSTSSATNAPVAQVRAEVTRLRAGTVLTMGPAVASRLGRIPHVRVVGVAKELPTVSPARGEAGLTVLVRQGMDQAALASVTAAAHAVGARLVSVSGADVRGDPTAIAALSEHRPRRVLAVGDGFGPVRRLADRLGVAETGVQLPGGGQRLFPGRRLVALYGHPGTASLGVLGEQGLDASIARAKTVAAQYDELSTVPVVPTLEIIATTAQASLGADGDYSGESTVATLRTWVDKAREEGVYVVLDLQPGRANSLEQAKRYAELLRLPNVGLALDPEWKLAPGQRPLGQIGSVDAAEVNAVTAWLADLTAKNALPQKLFVLHQFRPSMIRHEDLLDMSHDQVQLLIHMDGQGTPAMKEGTWGTVTAAAPTGMPFGWKNFYDEDHPMLTPAQTMTKKPTPLMISYQ